MHNAVPIRAPRLPVAVVAAFIAGLLPAWSGAAEPATPGVPDVEGHWRFVQEASEDVDDLIAKAIKKSGGKVKLPKGVGKNDYARFRGGPEDQELYDRLAYDRTFSLLRDGADYRLTHYHEDAFDREVGPRGRGRTVSASGSSTGDQLDYSFFYREDDALVVETRGRDGGFALERYRLVEGGRLEAYLWLEPLKFPARLEFTRVFERVDAPPELPGKQD